MSKQPMSFGQVWLRGCKVILALIALLFVIGIASLIAGALPHLLIPNRAWADTAGNALAGLFAPPVVYWAFSLFFDYDSQPSQKDRIDDTSEPSPCLLCHSVIPAGSDACPKCGWSYKN